MTSAEEIVSKLTYLRPVYENVQVMRAELESLGTVEQAEAAYRTATAVDDAQIDALRQTKRRLEGERFRLAWRQTEPWDSGPLHAPEPPPSPKLTGPRPSTFTHPPNLQALRAERIQLKKLINRWAPAWRLAPAIQSQINRIADDVDRPVGEALALLEWRVFEDRALMRENEATHLARLVHWSNCIDEYYDWLDRELEVMRARFRPMLPIWDLWCAGHQGPTENERWERFLAETRQAKREEIAHLQAEIKTLETELAELRARPMIDGGKP